jgi:hypothetical protein
MSKNLEQQIRKRLAAFVAGRLSLRDFNRWFVPAVWGIASVPVQQLVYEVKARLDEYDRRYLTKEELLLSLSLIAGSYEIGERKNTPSYSSYQNVTYSIPTSSQIPAMPIQT